MRYKSTSTLTGAVWMRCQEVRLKALMAVPEAERAQALWDFVGGDQRLYKEMYAGVCIRTKETRRGTFLDHLFPPGALEAERTPDLVDSVSRMLTRG